MSRSIASSILAIFSRKAIIIVVSILFTPLLVRFLGPASYGRYATVMSVFGITTFLLNSGTNDSIRKYLAEDRPTKWKSDVFGFHFRVALAVALVIVAVFVLAAYTGFVESVFGPEFVPLFLILAGYILARQFQSTLIRSLMGLKLEKYSEPLQVAQRVLFSAGALSLVYFGWGVPGVLFASIGADLVVASVAGLVLSRFLHLRSIFSSETPLAKREILSYAGGTALFFGCLMSLYHVDILMLTWWSDDATVGYYKGALMIAEMLWLVPSAVQLAMLQSTSHYWQHGEVNKIDQISSQITRLVTLLVVLMAIGLATLADSFVTLYLGPDFKIAVTPLILLLPGVIGFAVARPVLAISQAKGDMRLIIVATFGSALINFALNAVLIPEYGMVGAAIGTSVGYGSLPVFHAFVARHFGYSPFTGIRPIRVAVVAVPTAAIIYGIDSVVGSDIAALLLVPPIGGLLYLGLALRVGLITADERRVAISKLPDRWLEFLKS